ncbi:phosphoglycerate dehydrogenase [Heliobacterium gestii]|uniref:D-3-phosphoglycerate dehydrogenase n=1 Tax=Heliomicrobium gestii TaxID=2699 RepID=A0A845LGM7_HELGE|nr:phosphoglycerate dehydrogenase [Heliomicrobium gestii]MBM7868437.1 D-3-phosphoglycerate dehydrogenase [Heliomicrobium gestii]MZP44574.1 phosphoglycerate dehydrogenase [Heliomicrobium gestii]
MRVLVCDPISEKGIDVLTSAGDVAVDVKLKLTEDQIVEIIADYEAVVVRSETKITKRIIEAADRLKAIGRAGVGVDNIDVEAATLKGIVVVNAPEGNTIAAAELTVAHILAIARNVGAANMSLKNGRWDRSKYTGIELKGKTLGILGLGKIGSEVAKRARAFDMTVIAYDPYASVEKAKSLGVTVTDLDSVFRQSDFITVHMPKTKDTYRMISTEQFAIMKDGVRLVNCARGGIIDEEALCQAIESGKVAAAGIDVFEKEPCTESPLFGLDKVTVTPHLGASTKEAQVNVAIDVAYDILRVLRGEAVSAAVNIPAVKQEMMAVFQPYLNLVEKMGSYLGQNIGSRIEKVGITFKGDVAKYDVTPLTTTLLKGLLKHALEESVNYVNAPHVAKSRGIKVMEAKTPDVQDYAVQICVVVETDQGKHQVSGTLLRNKPRFVRIDEYDMDMAPEGHMLVVPHTDKPRIIGQLGTIIGEHNVNIAGMHLGRKDFGGIALAILNVDGPVPDVVLADLAKIDGVCGVKYVNLG